MWEYLCLIEVLKTTAHHRDCWQVLSCPSPKKTLPFAACWHWQTAVSLPHQQQGDFLFSLLLFVRPINGTKLSVRKWICKGARWRCYTDLCWNSNKSAACEANLLDNVTGWPVPTSHQRRLLYRISTVDF